MCYVLIWNYVLSKEYKKLNSMSVIICVRCIVYILFGKVYVVLLLGKYLGKLLFIEGLYMDSMLFNVYIYCIYSMLFGIFDCI